MSEYKIYTSYFSYPKLSTYNFPKVAISKKLPVWFKVDQWYKELAPSYRLVAEKTEPDEYIIKYAEEVLYKLDPHKVVEELNGCVLLCWEKENKFCHRHLVGEWLKTHTGCEVVELSNLEDKNRGLFD